MTEQQASTIAQCLVLSARRRRFIENYTKERNRLILKARDEGCSFYAVAQALEISRNTIYSVIRDENWDNFITELSQTKLPPES